MTTKLVFTSCMDALSAPVQPIWSVIAAQAPDHLLLLGDQIYMDYAFNSKHPKIGKPAEFSLPEFAASMHQRYESQWRVFHASALFKQANLKFHGIWDDHDFAWNNSFGDGGSNIDADESKKRVAVSRRKQNISRRLMRDFFGALNHRLENYPANPFATGNFAITEDLKVPMYCSSENQQVLELATGVKLYLSDSRSYRTAGSAKTNSALGAQQLEKIAENLSSNDILLLACGSTLDRGGEPLSDYGDYKNLLLMVEKKQAKLLALTGDVHKQDWREHRLARPRDKLAGTASRPVFEAVASGAARPGPFGGVGIFGLLRIETSQLKIELFEDGGKLARAVTIDRDRWQVLGN